MFRVLEIGIVMLEKLDFYVATPVGVYFTYYEWLDERYPTFFDEFDAAEVMQEERVREAMAHFEAPRHE
ncbi:MAG TPA: hypothetical protein VJ327_00285 [Patescibacteria group bacterium]|nr:hypothetical protein [Patescibacteria group bacterium]